MNYLYITCQDLPQHSMTINFWTSITKEPLSLVLNHGDRQETFTLILQTQFPKNKALYSLSLNNLHPNTNYTFEIFEKDTPITPLRTFKTLPNDDSSIEVLIAGDFEPTAAAYLLGKMAAKQNPDLIIFGGDYPRISLLKSWERWIKIVSETFRIENRIIPMALTLGNHEISKLSKKATYFFRIFPAYKPDTSYFSIQLSKQAKAYLLDTSHLHPHDGIQLEWLEQTLIQDTNIPIKLAIYHVPLYPSVRFTSKNLAYYFLVLLFTLLLQINWIPSLFSKKSLLGRKLWEPLFIKYGILAGFEHHEHALKRTKPIRNSQKHPEGIVYFGDGGFGCKRRFFPIQRLWHNYFAKTKWRTHFFWKVGIKGNKINYQAINKKGQTIDSYNQEIPPS